MSSLEENVLEQLSNLDPDDNFFNHFMPSPSNNACDYYSLENFNRLQQNDITLNLTFINYNIRSFFSNGIIFESFILTMNKPPDFMVLTETWNSRDLVNLCKFDNYSGIHTFREGMRGGGVSVFARNSEMSKIEDLSVCNSTIESCVSKITCCSKTLIIIGIYRPHSDTVENFLTALNNILNNQIVKNCEMVIISGDFNINLSDYNTTSVNNFSNCLNSMHFIPLITRPTRFPPNEQTSNPSTLDHIWINCLVPFKSGILYMDLTDHCPVFVNFNFGLLNENDSKFELRFRPFNKQNFNKLVSLVANVNWDTELDGNNIDMNCVKFIKIVNDFYCHCFPLKVKFLSRKRLQKPWLSPSLMKLIKQKSNYFKLFKMNIISKSVNNMFKNQVNKRIETAKNEYYLRAFDQSRTNIRRTWKIMHDLIGKNVANRKIKKLLIDNTMFTEDKDISERFNEFFKTAVTSLNENLPPSNTSPISYVSNSPVESLFSFEPITVSDCSLIIKNLKLTKNDINSIPVKLFISLHVYLSYPITKLINSSFNVGIFPDSLKVARITPVHKKGATDLPSNYRPISSLPLLSKIFERCAKDQLMEFCARSSVLFRGQFGFQKNKSTCDALIALTEKLYDNLNEKRSTLSVAIDLSKAFDSVNHDILTDKLMMYGIRGVPLNWFKTYLSNRKQYVRIGSSSSKISTLNISVPQGSILGPVLFLLYINDLPNATTMDAVLYVDDSTFVSSHSFKDLLLSQTNDQLVNVHEWCSSNKLHINSNKTEILKCSNRRDDFSSNSVLFMGKNVPFSRHVTLLGVLIDENLNFGPHINAVSSKLARSTGILFKIRNALPLQARLNYYYGLVYPYLTYNILIWGSTNFNHLSPLVIQQKRIIRIIANSNYIAHTSPLFYKLGLLKLVDIHKFQAAVYMYKNQFNDMYIHNHGLNTRNSHNLVPKHHKLSRTQQAISYVGPKIWNNLPLGIRIIPNLNTFKRTLKSYLLSHYVDS